MKTSTTIVIGGSATAPVITTEPEQLVARRGNELEWLVENTSGRAQEIALVGFSPANGSAASHPLEKPDADRKTTLETTGTIRDRVRGNAAAGTYKYEIWLNGAMAVDPEVVIREDN